MQKEIWKDIPDYEGDYQVSNYGNVKSLKFGKEIILKQFIRGSGYYKLCLCKNGVMKNYEAHKLVAISFLNHKPNRFKIVVNHIDGNRLNNNINNLELVTHRENNSICFRKNSYKKTSKYPGVYKVKKSNKWHSRILINGKRISLGHFDNEEVAYNAYCNAINNLIVV